MIFLTDLQKALATAERIRYLHAKEHGCSDEVCPTGRFNYERSRLCQVRYDAWLRDHERFGGALPVAPADGNTLETMRRRLITAFRIDPVAQHDPLIFALLVMQVLSAEEMRLFETGAVSDAWFADVLDEAGAGELKAQLEAR